MNEFTIQLNRLEFFGYHGLYPQEKQEGNFFYVDIEIVYAHPMSSTPTVKSIVDYSLVYERVAQRMTIPTELLEVLASDIAQMISNSFFTVKRCKVSVEKSKPPIGGPCQSVVVSAYLEV